MKHPVNDPCWCGSGIKFKKCHRDREAQSAPPIWQVEKDANRILKPSKCVVPSSMHSECSNRIINAHTVSKSANLKKLAVEGHVYGFKPSVQNLRKKYGLVIPEKIGVNKASTFTGFCGFHDKRIFEEIEDQPMVFSDSQCFKLAYRTVGREHYAKTNTTGLEEIFRSSDRGKSVASQRVIQGFSDAYFAGAALGVDDNTFHKNLYDALLISEGYSSVKKCVIKFNRTPSVMCSGGIFPDVDFEGNTLQSLLPDNPRLGAICFNVVATETGGAVVFTWLDVPENKACVAFIASLIRIHPSRMTDAFIRLFFEHCENTFMAPVWWEGLPVSTRDALNARMFASANPFQVRGSDCLMDDGIAYDDWGFAGIEQ